MRQPDLCERNRTILLADLVILRQQLLHNLRHAKIPFGIFVRWAGNDQRRAGFINQDIVNLINDGITIVTLHSGPPGIGQIIAQVVKAKFVVRAVGDIGQVSLLSGHLVQLILRFNR